MQSLGYNYRITDIQCALGRSQLKKLPDFIRRRQKIVDQYNASFRELSWLSTPCHSGWRIANSEGTNSGITGFRQPSDTTDALQPVVSYHLYTVQINFEALGKSRNEVMTELREQGVGTQVLYMPVYLQPWYHKTYGYIQGKCVNAEAYYLKSLSLPLFPAMTDADVGRVITAVRQISDADTGSPGIARP
jgi:dTDP-4-amino-4,6-dideoxygalactose transaminase